MFNLCFNKVLTRYAESQALEYPLSLIKPVRILLSLEKREQTHHAKLFFRAAIRAIIDFMLAAFFMFAMLSRHTFAFAQNALLKAEPPPPPHARGEVRTPTISVSNQFSQYASFQQFQFISLSCRDAALNAFNFYKRQ